MHPRAGQKKPHLPLARAGMFKATAGPAIEPAYTGYTTFVLAPTLTSYPGDADKTKEEFAELVKMGQRDIQYLSATTESKVYPQVISTGYSTEHVLGEAALAKCITALAAEEVKSVNFVITAHGSPGKYGKIGMGFDDEKHQNYRLTASDLVTRLEECGLQQLKTCSLNFSFRSCNSAYVKLDRHNEDQKSMEAKILDNSSIGEFFAKMKEVGYNDISVKGFRGFYLPAAGDVRLGDKKKKKISESEGTITINADRTVTFPESTKQLLDLQSTALDAECNKNATIGKGSAPAKKPRKR